MIIEYLIAHKLHKAIIESFYIIKFIIELHCYYIEIWINRLSCESFRSFRSPN